MAGDEKVERVRELSDLTEIVSDYVTLKRQGSNLVGLCPFHDEKTPSFSVSPERQLFYCFGCQAGGDVFTFVMMIEGMRFPEALRFLADRAGVVIPAHPEDAEEISRDQKRRDYLYRLAEFATGRFAENLAGNTGETAREYLASRGVGTELVKAYRLGYAEPGWSNLVDSLKRGGWSLRAAEYLGLVRKADAGHHYDWLRDRLIFPIADVRGRVVAFAGRALGDENPKYLNSPENPIFTKGRTWYGLDIAREAIRRRDRVIIVEGYTDVLACAREGWPEVVACMGTAVTPDQARMLARYTRNAFAAFDADDAGARAALRSFRSFAASGIDLKVMRFGSGDPADVLAGEDGKQQFEEVLRDAAGYFAFAWDQVLGTYDIGSARGKARAVASMAPVLAAEDDPVVRSDYIRRMAEELRLPEEAVRTGLRRALRAERRQAAGRADRRDVPPGEDSDESIREEVGLGQLRAERLLIAMMLANADYLRWGREILTPEDFRSRSYSELAERILTAVEEDPHRLAGALVADVSGEEMTELAGIMLGEDIAQDQRAFEDCTDLLKRRTVQRRLEELQRTVGDMQRRDETIPVQMMQEQARLLRELKGSGEHWRSSRGQRE